MRSYFDALLRYFEFSGRTSRSGYWLFQLVYVVLFAAAVYADFRFDGSIPTGSHVGLFSAFVAFFHIVPSITITVRRLHDIGRSGWWYLLFFVPLAGILVFVWTFFPSQDGSNDYGDDPRNGSSRPDPTPAAAASYRGVRTGNAQPSPARRMEGQSVATQRFI